jgi:hypothetical protein
MPIPFSLPLKALTAVVTAASIFIQPSRSKNVLDSSAIARSDGRTYVEFSLNEVVPSRRIPGKNFSRVRSAKDALVVQHGVRSFTRYDLNGSRRCAHVIPDSQARITEFGVSSRGEVVAVDARKRALYRFARCGANATTVHIGSAFVSVGVLPSGDLLLNDSTDATFSTIKAQSGRQEVQARKVTRVESMPREPMLRQGRFAASEQQQAWIFAYSFWSRIELDGTGKQIHTVDSISLPRIERVESATGTLTRMASTAVAHRGVTYLNGVAYVLPGSRSDKQKNGIIDLYSTQTEGYRGSLQLKEPILDISADSRRVFLLTPSGVYALELVAHPLGQ